MPQTRPILILCSDPLVGRFYGQMFARIGLRAEIVEDFHTGLTRARTRTCALVLTDLIHETINIVDFIQKTRSQDPALPILVFAENPPALAQEAREAGATLLLGAEHGSINEIYRQLNATVGADAATALTSEPDPAWVARLLHEMPQLLHSLRLNVFSLAKSQSAQAAKQQIHHLGRRCAILGNRTACALAVAVENLLWAVSDSSPASTTLHTLTEALDLLTHLVDPQTAARVGDPAGAQALVLDPEEPSRLLMASSLEGLRFKPTCTHDSEQALAYLGSSPRELLILEAALDCGSGFEFCRKIRHLPSGISVPVLFVGKASLENRIQSNLSGGNDFLGKPFEGDELALKSLVLVLKARLGSSHATNL